MEAERPVAKPRAEPISPERPAPTSDDEIDLADLVRQIWARKRIVWITMLIVFAIGVFIAIVSPEQYEARVVLMPQSSEASSGAGSGLLRQFGGLAGLGLGGMSGSGTLNAELYPEITQSTPFYLDIIEEDLYFSTLDTTVSLAQYFSEIEQPGVLDYVKRYTIGLPGIIINLPATLINAIKDEPVKASASDIASVDKSVIVSDTLTDRPIKLTGRQRAAIGKIKGRVTTLIEENGTVNITVEMPDPLVAAEATRIAKDYLTDYIVEYRTEKVQKDLVFIQKQYDEKKDRYRAIQRRLARFRDRNMNIISETARIEQEQLEAENQLAYDLYRSLEQQLEQAQIKVQEETPVFKVLEPIQIPHSKSKPNRELIIILSLLVGLFLGLGIVFMIVLYNSFNNMLSASS